MHTYEAIITQYGDSGAESYEYQKTLLEEMIAHQDLIDQINEVIAATINAISDAGGAYPQDVTLNAALGSGRNEVCKLLPALLRQSGRGQRHPHRQRTVCVRRRMLQLILDPGEYAVALPKSIKGGYTAYEEDLTADLTMIPGNSVRRRMENGRQRDFHCVVTGGYHRAFDRADVHCAGYTSNSLKGMDCGARGTAGGRISRTATIWIRTMRRFP